LLEDILEQTPETIVREETDLLEMVM
jgi:hypothetical protein